MEQAQARLKAMFETMPQDVPLVLFTSPVRNQHFSQAARQMIRAIREMAPRVTLREYDLEHQLAVEHGVREAPTILFDPEHYRIRCCLLYTSPSPRD